MEALADLHTHTTCSDGILTPAELVTKAVQRKLRAIAITDHDTVDAIEDARKFISENKLQLDVVAGIEISSSENERDVHILGYFVDVKSQLLSEYTQVFRLDRERRAKKIVENLNKMNVPLEFDEVQVKAGEAPIGRPHIAAALIENGHSLSFEDAFRTYLHNNSPAYEPRTKFPVAEAVKLIHDAGGIAILAHPGRYFADPRMLMPIVKSGIDGVEVNYPTHGRMLSQYYHVFAKQHKLLETGGSDFHGSRFYDEENFGKYGVSLSTVERLKLAAEKRGTSDGVQQTPQ